MRFGMFLNGLGTSRTSSSGKRPAKQAPRRAVRQVLCEDLEKRQLLSSYSFSGYTQVYLKPDQADPSAGIEVHLGSPTAPVAAELDGSTSGNTDTITTYDSGVTLYDEVPAVYQPTGGISFQSGPDGGMVIQAGDNDTDISVPSTSSTGSTIELYDPTDGAPGVGVTVNDVIGGDVTSLTLQTNSVAATSSTDGTTVVVAQLVSTVALTVNTEGGTYDAVTIGGYDAGVHTALVVTGAGNDSVVLANDGDGDAPVTATVDFGAGTGTGDGTGLGNTLEVETGCTATLAQAPGSAGHTVVVDRVTVDPPEPGFPAAILVVSDPSTIGDLSVGNYDAAHVNAASTINSMEVESSGVAYVDAPSTLGAVTVDGTLYVDSGSTVSTLTVDADGAAYVDSGTSTFDTVTVEGSGDLYINSGSTIGTMDVQSDGLCDIAAASPITTLTVEGTVKYNESGSWLGNASVIDTNTIGSLTISGGVVDIGTQELLVTDTTPSTVTGYVISAYNGGGTAAWQGSGITSSSASAPANLGIYAVGYATYGDNSTTGLSLSGNQVLMRPTVAGDATLDGTTNFTDFASLQRNYNKPGDWVDGDFNYDNYVNFSDFLIFQANDGTTYTATTP